MPSPRRPSSGGNDPKRGDRSQLITHGGLRFVGPAAALVSDPHGVTLDASLRPEDILYAGHFRIRPIGGKGDAVSAVLSVLSDAVARAKPDATPLGRGGPLAESWGRFHGMHWDTFASGDSWTGELTWIHPHPTLGGVPCTTHVVLIERGQDVSATIRVGAHGGSAGVYGHVGAGQVRPAFLSELKRLTRLSFHGGSAEFDILGDLDVRAFVHEVLLVADRAHPVAVLAPIEPVDYLQPARYLVPPAELAEELLGLARLHVLERHPTTFRLTDELGDRRWSCYWGAFRVYLPGFSTADDPMRHPLLTRDRIEDPVVRAGVLGQLGVQAGRRIRVPDGVLALREETARRSAVEVVTTSTRSGAPVQPVEPPAPQTAGDDQPQIVAAPTDEVRALVGMVHDTFSELSSKMAELVRLNTSLLDEVASLSTATAVRAANTAGVERRLAQFERMLREHIVSLRPSEVDVGASESADAAEESEEVADVTLVSVVQHAEAEYADALLILDSAIASASESPYQDVHRVATYLKAMADLARRRQQDRLKASLRDAFQEVGIEYRGGISESTPKRLRQQYLAHLSGGRSVECHEHLVLGTSYDPRHCLRIYFTSRAPGEPRFVIAHVGRHFDVTTTT